MQSEPKTGSKTLCQSKGEQKREHHEIEGIGSKTEQKRRKEGPAMPLHIQALRATYLDGGDAGQLVPEGMTLRAEMLLILSRQCSPALDQFADEIVLDIQKTKQKAAIFHVGIKSYKKYNY